MPIADYNVLDGLCRLVVSRLGGRALVVMVAVVLVLVPVVQRTEFIIVS